MKKDKLVRVDPRFEALVRRMARERIANGKDQKLRRMRSIRRLTLAISRHPLIRKIEEDIVNADLEPD